MHRAARVLAFALALVAAPAGAGDGPIPPSKCTAAKHAAYGRYVSGQEACIAKGRKRGGALSVECFEKNAAKLAKALASAEKKGDCVQLGNAALVLSVSDLFESQLTGILETEAICCEITGRCAYTQNAGQCLNYGGTAGAAGTTCSGTGACVAEAPTPGTCCTAEGLCVGGPFTEPECDTFVGTFEPNALCLPNQSCLAFP
jgi:hypothetical protein